MVVRKDTDISTQIRKLRNDRAAAHWQPSNCVPSVPCALVIFASIMKSVRPVATLPPRAQFHPISFRFASCGRFSGAVPRSTNNLRTDTHTHTRAHVKLQSELEGLGHSWGILDENKSQTRARGGGRGFGNGYEMNSKRNKPNRYSFEHPLEQGAS